MRLRTAIARTVMDLCTAGTSGRRVAPPWPRRMACLPRLAGTVQCRCGVGLSSEREDDQDDVSNPCTK